MAPLLSKPSSWVMQQLWQWLLDDSSLFFGQQLPKTNEKKNITTTIPTAMLCA
jgi:hypothetical protein